MQSIPGSTDSFTTGPDGGAFPAWLLEEEARAISENPQDKRDKRDKSFQEPGSQEENAGAAGWYEDGQDGAADPFPTELLPPVIQAAVRETARVTQTPDALPAVVALGLLSAALGAGLVVRSGAGRITPANLFVVGIARSGTGKGRVFSVLAESFHRKEREVVDRWMQREKPRIEAELSIVTRRSEAKGREATKESDPHARRMLTLELVELETERMKLEKERDAQPRYSVGDVTREMLAVALSGQPGEALASLSAESRGIIGVMMGKYSSGKSSDEDIYLSGYSGDAVRVDRMTRAPVMLSAPRLSLLWLMQPDVAQKLADDERMTEGGLLPRLLLCDVKAECEDEPEDFQEMTAAVEAAWARLVQGLMEEYRDQGGQPRGIGATAEAQRLLRDYTNESKRQTRTGGPLADVQSYAVRWGENAWRLALCLHAAAHGVEAHRHELGAETAREAIGIVAWFSRAQLDFLAVSRSGRAKSRLDRLTEILRLSGGRETVRMLKKAHHFDESELRGLAERFPTRLVLEVVRTVGRQSLTVRLPG